MIPPWDLSLQGMHIRRPWPSFDLWFDHRPGRGSFAVCCPPLSAHWGWPCCCPGPIRGYGDAKDIFEVRDIPAWLFQPSYSVPSYPLVMSK